MWRGNDMSNLTAGIGDPYWYEWLVGVNYALDMLSPDTDISYVTLQASSTQGLDDVIVGYTDGSIKGVQVKHTRKNDTLTFNDLICSEEGGRSLLSEVFFDWKTLKKKQCVQRAKRFCLLIEKAAIGVLQ